MNNLGKTFFLLFLAATMLASCGGSPSTPTLQDAEIMQTAVSSAGTRLAESLPTGTPTAGLLPTVSFFVLPTQTALAPNSALTTEAYLIVDAGAGIESVRSGPGIEFELSGYIQSPTRYPVIGKYRDWWLLDLGNNQSGWIQLLGRGTKFVGNAEAVPEVAPPAAPTPSPTSASNPNPAARSACRPASSRSWTAVLKA